MTLFDHSQNPNTLPPLAERMRPRSLETFLGQNHLLAKNRLVAQMLESNRLFSLILWGPPGCGKTTLSKLFANRTNARFHELSAVSAGVKDVRETLAKARADRELGRPSVLFIDEIHRFNKAQQDALLQAVEGGVITLIGATTENPSFEVIAPLLSRCQVLRLQPLAEEDLLAILQNALDEDLFLSTLKLDLSDEVRDFLVRSVGGDARRLLNALEIAVAMISAPDDGRETLVMTQDHIREALQNRHALYDKAGDYHYDAISAFIKSVRGSDPDAALYWLAVMIAGGEDPIFIARRLIILASEDVGNADPQALTLATSAFQAVHAIGMPEGAIVLGQATTYLASTTKSNAAYLGLRAAQASVQDTGALDVPLHLRNAPTRLMKDQGFGQDYRYPHDADGHFVHEDYFPKNLENRAFYLPTHQGIEKRIYERLKQLWPERFRDEAGKTH